MRYPHIASILFALALFSACGGQSPAPISQVAAAQPGPLILDGAPDSVDLGPTVETVWNCGEGPIITKHPSRSVGTNYSVEWQVGGTSGFGIIIGQGIIPGGIDLTATLEGRYVTGFDQSGTQGNGWDLPADPNTKMTYTLMWREIWQRAHSDVRLADQSVARVEIRYRTGIQSDIVGKERELCGNQNRPSVPNPTAVPAQPTQPTNPQRAPTTRPTAPVVRNDVNLQSIDAVLGEGNWSCFQDRLDGISVRNIPAKFVVKHPIALVDKNSVRYQLGESVPPHGSATAWLTRALSGYSDCPNNPQSPSFLGPITRSSIDGVLGADNWQCFPDRLDGVRILSVPTNFAVRFPLSVVDKDSQRYEFNDAVPSGGIATGWLQGALSDRNECP